MKRILLLFLLFILYQTVTAQVINQIFNTPPISGKGGVDLYSVKQTTAEVIVTFQTKDYAIRDKKGNILDGVSPTFCVSSLIYMVPGKFPSDFKCGLIPWRNDEDGIRSSLSRFKAKRINGINFNTNYYCNGGNFQITFSPTIAYGNQEYTIFELIEINSYGDCLGYQVGRTWNFRTSIDYPIVRNIGIPLSSIKDWISKNNNGIFGIYKGTPNLGNEYTLALIEHNNQKVLIYIDSAKELPQWKLGDYKAVLRNTETTGLYCAKWNLVDKSTADGFYVKLDDSGLIVRDPNGYDQYYKMVFPLDERVLEDKESKNSWTGTGFALENGYIVTNYHVIDGASHIQIYGVNGDFTKGYKARVISFDKKNDLALIRIDNTDFGKIPYSIKTSLALVGEDIFVLGYPMAQYMGQEIKLTNGIISSHSGYQGDISTYQITAPVQPGNSGGPLFDYNGNIVGIINAGIPSADNVGYAIKTSYLKNLVESSVKENIIPYRNSISTNTLANKVQSLKNFVFLIKCH